MYQPLTMPCALQERAEIIAQHWLQEGRVPTPRQVRERRLGGARAVFDALCCHTSVDVTMPRAMECCPRV